MAETGPEKSVLKFPRYSAVRPRAPAYGAYHSMCRSGRAQVGERHGDL